MPAQRHYDVGLLGARVYVLTRRTGPECREETLRKQTLDKYRCQKL